MTQRTDYSQVEIPDDVPPTEYHYTQRRAEILELVLRAGGPAAINQSTLADRYGVNKSTVSRDLDRLSESIGDQLGSHIDLTVKAAFDRAIEHLHEEGKHREAFDVALDWSEWLADRGHVDRAPDEVDVSLEDAWLAKLQHHYDDE